MAKLSLFGKGKPKADDPKDEDEPAATSAADDGENEEDDPKNTEGDEPEEQAAGEGEGEGEEDEVASTQAALDQAVANQKAARADVARLARAAERARVAAILNSEEAAARPNAARTFAFDTDLPPGRVAAKLAKRPAEASGRGGLAAAMADQPRPRVTPDAGRSAAKPTAGLRAAVTHLLPKGKE